MAGKLVLEKYASRPFHFNPLAGKRPGDRDQRVLRPDGRSADRTRGAVFEACPSRQGR